MRKVFTFTGKQKDSDKQNSTETSSFFSHIKFASALKKL